mmetsp:Transcript_78300/g.227104  ORF Transcript_78300/g.227104 Transcript_78300/m.227104 type:complete len:307 (+) Transcript_78300:385-1305(+)
MPMTPTVSNATIRTKADLLSHASLKPVGSNTMDSNKHNGVAIHITHDTIVNFVSGECWLGLAPLVGGDVSTPCDGLLRPSSEPRSRTTAGSALSISWVVKTACNNTHRSASSNNARTASAQPKELSASVEDCMCCKVARPCNTPPIASRTADNNFSRLSCSKPQSRAMSSTASTFVAKIIVLVDTLRSNNASFFTPRASPCNKPITTTVARPPEVTAVKPLTTFTQHFDAIVSATPLGSWVSTSGKTTVSVGACTVTGSGWLCHPVLLGAFEPQHARKRVPGPKPPEALPMEGPPQPLSAAPPPSA